MTTDEYIIMNRELASGPMLSNFTPDDATLYQSQSSVNEITENSLAMHALANVGLSKHQNTLETERDLIKINIMLKAIMSQLPKD